MSAFALHTTRHRPARAFEQDGCRVFDFGELMVGAASFTTAADCPVVVEAHYGEHLAEALRTRDYTCGWYRLPKDRIAVAPGAARHTTPGRRAFRYLALRLEPRAAPVAFHDVEAECRHYPVAARGAFRCSDPLLNRAWELSERTTRLCMQQYYEDGVKRDGLLWIGDYRVQFLCNSLLFGDTALARKSLQLIAASVRPDGIVPACAVVGGAHQHDANINYMPNVLGKHSLDTLVILNYVTDFICAVREYLEFSGDPGLLRELWPVLKNQIRFVAGLTAGQPVLPEYGHHVDVHNGTWHSRGVLAFQCLEALRDAAWLAARMDDRETGSQVAEWTARHLAWIAGSLHIPGRPPLLRNEPGEDATGHHVHTHAFLSGYLADPQAFLAAQRLAAGRPESFAPRIGMAQFYHLLALCRAGDMAAALAFIRQVAEYLLQHDSTTCWEIIDPTHADKGGFDSDTVARSYCHGWSAAPAYLFPRFLLGVEPLAPGLRSVRVRPLPGGLEWAEGAVPTPHGDLRVAWKRSASGLDLRVDAPPGVEIVQP